MRFLTTNRRLSDSGSPANQSRNQGPGSLRVGRALLLMGAFLSLLYSAPLRATLIDDPALRVAGSFTKSFFGPRLFFSVDEVEEGVDLNGDGDATDLRVAHVFDGRDSSLVNLGLALAPDHPSVLGTTVVLTVSEEAQGEDLNGDKVLNDEVAVFYDIPTETIFNPGFRSIDTPRLIGNVLILRRSGDHIVIYDPDTRTLFDPDVTGITMGSRGRIVLLSLWERTRRNTPIEDFNGDGDFADSVVHEYNLDTGNIVNLGLAESAVLSGSLTNSESGGNLCAFTVFETRQRADLNGDTDRLDTVLHVYNYSTREVSNLGFAISDIPNPGLDLVGVDMGRVAFVVPESDQGGTDLNNDGDVDDEVVHVYNALNGLVTCLELTMSSRDDLRDSLELSGSVLSFPVDEFGQGFTDFNGDGDLFDRVAHVYDTVTGELTNLGVAGDIRNVGDLLMINADEIEQGLTDLNSDGDFLDLVPMFYDPVSRVFTTVPVAIDPVESTFRRTKGSGSIVTFQVDEQRFGGQDLDGDGQVEGIVPFVFDASSGRLTNLGQRSSSFAVTSSHVCYDVGGPDVLYDTRTGLSFDVGSQTAVLGKFLLAFRLFEDEVLEDLNGDGDQLDRIVNVVILDRALGAGNVNGGVGQVTDVLSVSGQTGTVTVSTGTPIELTLNSSPQDLSAKYFLWVWPGRPSQETEIFAPGGASLGLLVNALPIGPGLDPQPIRCIRSSNSLPLACSGSARETIGPPRAPFSLMSSGLANPVNLTIQGVIEDTGSASAVGLSVTNAIILQVRD